jgi:hypothetical protein
MSTDPNFANFVGLSSILTGFTQEEIAPEIDPIGTSSEYLQFMETHADPVAFPRMLSTYAEIASKFPPLDPSNPDPAVVAQISALVSQRIMADPAMGPVARRTIRMWYLSTWYTTEPPDPNNTTNDQVISMNAYTQGLAWEAAQAHPMGFSELHFGYWAVAPPANDVSPNSFPQVNVSSSPTNEAEAGVRPVALQRGGI